MGKKKPNARGDDEAASIAHTGSGGGGTKSKKKALFIDDDEYSMGTEISEDLSIQEDMPAKSKDKKGNAKGVKKQQNSAKEEEDDAEDSIEIVFSGKKKSHGTKGGSKNSKFASSNFSMLESGDVENDIEDDTSKAEVAKVKSSGDEEEDLVVSFTGMKKKKSGKSKGKPSTSAFSALMGDDEGISVDEDEDDQQIDKPNLDAKNEIIEDDDLGLISFSGKKKKSSKGSKKAAENLEKETNGERVSISLSSVTVDDDEAEDGDDESLVSFAGKKKSSKSSKKPLERLERETNYDEASMSTSAVTVNDAAEDEDDVSFVSFAGKKKSSKKKATSNTFSSVIDDEVSEVAAINKKPVADLPVEDAKVIKTEEITENSKNKKKKKKSNRTAQEEEDLDKILAELGEAPTVSTVTILREEDVLPPQAEPVVEEVDGEKNDEEEKEESAAAKKKKKKKEKEKEKKAAALSAAEKTEEVAVEREPKKIDAKGKVADKKVPKHVREMQEAIARRKEMEERKAREEEEKLRKEEEERKRLEELERLAEEKKRMKKEREKEKLLKKKQEGKLLTVKQKEEQKRLEAMRNQFLANTGVPIATGDKEIKRPKYQTKKSKQPQQRANDSATAKEEEAKEHVESIENDLVEEVESEAAEEKTETLNGADENGEEDDDDWDAKSWDDVDIDVKGAFDDEVDEEPEPIVKKESNSFLNKEKAMVSQKPVSEQQANTHREGNKQVSPRSDAPNANSSEPLGKTETLRSPICCIMGHVDTGKTKLLDCIRGTNVQEGEAGGITQQIGATYFPAENIRERTKELKADANLKVPGLLVIDTPGHESFTNLRSRGSGLCDIAILVVDIMHGLEPQTIESLNLLKLRNTEFIVALNKVDRLYGWKVCRNAPIQKAMKMQSKDVVNEFNMRLVQIITQFKEQGLNTELYYKNKEMGETYSIVPTSAISGEGIPDMLLLLVHWTQKTMVKKLTYSEEVQCTVLEVKVVEGHGTTIDVVLVNGVLHEGDQIIVCGSQGPIVTSIRALLTPHPMKELRVKGTYLHHKEIKAAQGIKITAQGLEHAIAGTALYVVGPGDDVEDMKEVAMQDMKQVMSRIDKSGEGVYVQASTLGALEALLEFLKSPAVSIPVSGIGIGPVHKKDVMKASVMLEKKKEYATILAFDVKVTPEARELADELGVTIFIADIIYHLFDQFKAYITRLRDEKKKEVESEAVFPCILKIMPNCVFMKKDPIVLGVDVVDGILRVGTPICIPQREFIDIGKIASIENNHKAVDSAKKGQQVAIKIVGTNPEEQQKMFGRHFDYEDELVSHISRKSIDVLKANYREDLSIDEWKLVVKLKNLFKIQ